MEVFVTADMEDASRKWAVFFNFAPKTPRKI